MKLIAALSVPVLAVGFGALIASPASAHTPDIDASCGGVHVGATAYDANMANRWSVTINGTTQSGTFGASFDQTFPVPQGGATSTWSAFVEAADGTYHTDQSGSVGPCGTPPPVDVCQDLPGDQPEGTACTPPPDVQRADAQQLGDCAVDFNGTSYGAGDLTYDEQYTDTYVFNEQTNTWDLVTDTEPTIANVVFTPWTVAEQVQNGCTETAEQPPAEQSKDSSTKLDCDDEVQVTTTVTSTTPYVYDEDTNDWVPGETVKDTTVKETPVQPGDCDTDQGVSPNDASVHTTPVNAQVLPVTAQVPTSVDAGLAGASPLAAMPVSTVSAPAASEQDSRTPALVLVLMGMATIALGAFRIRRS